jgi:hypothetical protein
LGGEILEQWTESFGTPDVSVPISLPSEAEDLWHQLIDQIKELVTKEDFGRWFEDMMYLDIQEDRLLIQVPRKLDALWINNHY